MRPPMRPPIRPDTRKLLVTGSAIFLSGCLAVLLADTVFGGLGRQGPHTNMGWLCPHGRHGMPAHRHPHPPARPSRNSPATAAADTISAATHLLSSSSESTHRSNIMAKGVNKVLASRQRLGKDPGNQAPRPAAWPSQISRSQQPIAQKMPQGALDRTRQSGTPSSPSAAPRRLSGTTCKKGTQLLHRRQDLRPAPGTTRNPVAKRNTAPKFSSTN